MKKICFIAILALAGCQSQHIVHFANANLATQGPVEINVESFRGNISIIADPTVAGTVVTAKQVEEHANGLPTAEPKMQCTTKIEMGDNGQIVHVVATSSNDVLQLVHADIVVRSNLIHDVYVTTTKGDVTLLGVSGAITVHTNDGDVRLVTPRVINQDVTIENRRGNIVYRVRGESSGMIDAQAINGDASLDVRHGEATILPGSTGDHLVAKVNGGINNINMRTVDGNIHIAVVADPIGSEPLFGTDWISW
ncbi:MAG: hypothetical protein CMJ26_07080 [Phycisphaerae bacterium]|nr:hypothetical protein [Phycisphaerae bacterium]